MKTTFFPLRSVEQQNTKHTGSCVELAAVVAVPVGTVPENGSAFTASQKSITTESGGKLYRRPYHDKLDVLRLDKKNCGRCGKPNSNGHRQCDRCRAYAVEYKARMRGDIYDAQQAAGMIVQMRRELSRLRATITNMANDRRRSYAKGYAKGFETGKTTAKYFDTLPEMSKQELSTISHAYDSNED